MTNFFVYMLKSTSSVKKKTYVGYTNNLINRVIKHNTNKGAKYTKGNLWELIYFKKFNNKKEAMSYEYKLKKNKILRNTIYKDYK